MQVMGLTGCPEMIVVVFPIVEMVEKLSHHHSDIPVEFHSRDTSTA
jgi:hypothetical protein